MFPASSPERSLVRADHRKPVVAFVLLACAAAVLIGMQRAEAQSGRFFTSFLGLTARVEGALPGTGRFVAGPRAATPAEEAWFSGLADAVSDGGPSSEARPAAAAPTAVGHRGSPSSRKDAAEAGRTETRGVGMEPAGKATVRAGRRLVMSLGRTSPGQAGFTSARRHSNGVGRVGRDALHRRRDHPPAEGLSRRLRRAGGDPAHDAARLQPAD